MTRPPPTHMTSGHAATPKRPGSMPGSAPPTAAPIASGSVCHANSMPMSMQKKNAHTNAPASAPVTSTHTKNSTRFNGFASIPIYPPDTSGSIRRRRVSSYSVRWDKGTVPLPHQRPPTATPCGAAQHQPLGSTAHRFPQSPPSSSAAPQVAPIVPGRKRETDKANKPKQTSEETAQKPAANRRGQGKWGDHSSCKPGQKKASPYPSSNGILRSRYCSQPQWRSKHDVPLPEAPASDPPANFRSDCSLLAKTNESLQREGWSACWGNVPIRSNRAFL